MRYVGNASLSQHIQERILNTFQQTLGLAQEGNHQEALLGCDFILRLDPLFEPARRLQERMEGAEGAVDVADLQEFAPGGGGASPKATEPADETAQPAAPEPIATTEVAPPVESPGSQEAAPVSDNLPAKLALLLEQRSYQDLLTLAGENQERIASDPDLSGMAQIASERLEAEPYVKSFIESARQAKNAGDIETSKADLQKARELDATHPDLMALDADLSVAGAPVVEPSLEEAVELDFPDLGEPTAEPSTLVAPLEEPTVEPSTQVSPPPTEPALAPQVDLSLDDSQQDADSLFQEIEGESATPPDALTPSLGTEPAARLDGESEQRIGDLLQEGQEAFEKGEYQSAIDAWSRIFLIDIDHAEASRRIELARKLKAEVERQIEEAFHEGISLLEAGEVDQAREAFEKLLESQPNHMGAKDYLEKLASGDLGLGSPESPESPAPPDLAPVEAPTPVPAEALETDDEALELAEPAAAPVPDDDLATEPVIDAPASPAPRRRSFALIGAAVLILVLVVGWFVFSKWDQMFPNAESEQQASDARPQVDPVERARELHEAGNTAMAINLLRRLPPGHAQYSEAQSLISMWESGTDRPDDASSDLPSEEELARREALLEAARAAAGSGENLRVIELLDQAALIAGLEQKHVELRLLANDELELIQNELDMFHQGDWEYALPNLWRQHEADPQNKDITRLMVDCYYNLGLRDLQRGDSKSALEKLEEAETLAPEDIGVERLKNFALAYSQRQSDLLYRIFVKYHPFR